MNEIGGFFELELREGTEYHSQAIKLNTGRNCLEYILRTRSFTKIYIPSYTCEVVLEPIVKLGMQYEFYPIDKQMNPVCQKELSENEAILLTNYYGLKSKVIFEYSKRHKNIIVDNSQAFFSKPLPGVDTFYSARKFFGVPDGAYLYTDVYLSDEPEQDFSYKRCEHLLGRIDISPDKFYDVFKRNDDSFINQPIKKMSKLTERLLKSIDYDHIIKRRKENFIFLHNLLGNMNLLEIDLQSEDVPMIYPLLVENGEAIKKHLIENKIYVATYWPNVFEWNDVQSSEYELAKKLVCIPIDQRYDSSDLLLIYNNIDICTKS